MKPILQYSRIIGCQRRADYRGYEIHAIIGDIDVRAGTNLIDLIKEVQKIKDGYGMNYNDLTKDERWMPDNWRPDEIGGRQTDISQIAYCLIDQVKRMFPVNAVPKPLDSMLIDLEIICRHAEECIQKTIQLITDYKCKKED